MLLLSWSASLGVKPAHAMATHGLFLKQGHAQGLAEHFFQFRFGIDDLLLGLASKKWRVFLG
jgi:hypothetical protein